MVKIGAQYHNIDGSTILPATYGHGEFAVDKATGGFSQYGKMHLRDQSKLDMDDWLATDGIHDVVAQRTSVGMKIPVQGVYEIAGAPINGITITQGTLDVNMRDMGPYLSKMHQLREDVINYLRSDAGEAMKEHFDAKGMSIEDIDNLAIGYIGDSAFATIGRNRDGKITLYANPNFFKDAEKHGKYFGLTANEKKELTIAEELGHNFRKSYDQLALIFGRLGVIPEEVATKKDVTAIYTRLAEHTTDPVVKAKYTRMAWMKHIDTLLAPVTYARAAFRKSANKSSELEDLVSEAVEETSEMTEEAAAEYVASKVIEHYYSSETDSLEDAVEDSEGSADESGEGSSDGGE
ncbi:MAG: hypothetical protein O2779_05580 [Nanoarchaeota archaeon]|nr:hypothetical protein [Nanoarchaeota archaeon]